MKTELAQSTAHQSGAFVGGASDLKRNLDMLLADVQLTPEERAEWDRLYKQNVTDWRVSPSDRLRHADVKSVERMQP